MIALAEIATFLSLTFGINISCPPLIPYYDKGYALGVYRVKEHRIELDDAVCARLDLLRKGARPRGKFRVIFGEAIFVLAHELGHAAGRGKCNELCADNYAYRHFVRISGKLGIERRFALQIMP